MFLTFFVFLFSFCFFSESRLWVSSCQGHFSPMLEAQTSLVAGCYLFFFSLLLSFSFSFCIFLLIIIYFEVIVLLFYFSPYSRIGFSGINLLGVLWDFLHQVWCGTTRSPVLSFSCSCCRSRSCRINHSGHGWSDQVIHNFRHVINPPAFLVAEAVLIFDVWWCIFGFRFDFDHSKSSPPAFSAGIQCPLSLSFPPYVQHRKPCATRPLTSPPSPIRRCNIRVLGIGLAPSTLLCVTWVDTT